MKVLINIVGPGASGKSTLSRNILEDPSINEVSTTVQALDQHRGTTMVEKVKYTLSGNGIALAGNWKNGSDSIKSMDLLPKLSSYVGKSGIRSLSTPFVVPINS